MAANGRTIGERNSNALGIDLDAWIVYGGCGWHNALSNS
jgi:hypothetical protein